jgi:chlorobactene glucosyltransferase
MGLLTFLIIHTTLCLVCFGLTFLFFRYFRRLKGFTLPDNELPFVSVLVPARNEGGKIGRCLESLARQNYPIYEVVAVDDCSTDNTGEIIKSVSARYPNVKFAYGAPTPPGWIGKCSALVTASKSTSPESRWYLFTDADTCHTADSLRYSVSYALQNNAELISFMPVQELGSFWERLVMPVLLGSFLCGDPYNTINEKTNDRAYAYGQYILMHRGVYEEVDGHESVHDQILDDIALARVIKSKGHRVMSADGRLLYSVRMYTNLETLWNGWTKNLYALIECNMLFLVLVVLLINSGILLPWINLAAISSFWLTGEVFPELPACTALAVLEMVGLYAWYKRTSEHYRGVNTLHFFLLPFGSLTVSVLYFHAAYLVLSGTRVKWKGRRYTVHTSKTVDQAETALEDAGTGAQIEQPLLAVPTDPRN